MRILMVHNFYQQAGGEDSVVNSEIEMLRNNGHEVFDYCRHNNEIVDVSRLKVAIDTFWSTRTVNDIEALIAKVKPDVIHCHNTFPLISPSLYWAAAKHSVPVVQTLHNFRLLCPQAMFLRNGVVCEDCMGKIPWRGIVHGCYRESPLQSAVLAGMLTTHRTLGAWQHKVTRFIALNDFCRNKFIEGGLSAEKILVKPNFVDWDAPSSNADMPLDKAENKSFLFVGRLSVEKGISVLLDAVAKINNNSILRVAGVGPQDEQLTKARGITALGALNSQEVYKEMCNAFSLVLPSIWYENFPRTLVEAYASGLPVIASRLGAMAELVIEGETGLLFEAGNASDLAKKMKWALENPLKMVEMGRNARRYYELSFTAKRNYEQLIAIYNEAIDAL